MVLDSMMLVKSFAELSVEEEKIAGFLCIRLDIHGMVPRSVQGSNDGIVHLRHLPSAPKSTVVFRH